MAELKTNFKDDILDTTQNQLRKYRMINNDDGTVSFVDVTEYLQTGDSFGAAQVNESNAIINDIFGKVENLQSDVALNIGIPYDNIVLAFGTNANSEGKYGAFVPMLNADKYAIALSRANILGSGEWVGDKVLLPEEMRSDIGFVVQCSNSAVAGKTVNFAFTLYEK